jgi:hypothetical protein
MPVQPTIDQDSVADTKHERHQQISPTMMAVSFSRKPLSLQPLIGWKNLSWDGFGKLVCQFRNGAPFTKLPTLAARSPFSSSQAMIRNHCPHATPLKYFFWTQVICTPARAR